MTCFAPLRARKDEGGRIALGAKATGSPLSLPCGKCIGCRAARAREWAIRCVHEAQMHEQSCFVTLTYDPKHVPSDGGLNVRDWQLFAKRVRKRYGRFRFIQCGEYGERNFRPHHHALLFGIDFPDKVLFKSRPGRDLYTSALLSGLWRKGFCSIGGVSYSSAEYVARYVIKNDVNPVKTERYRRIDYETGEEYYVRREYLTMSRRPGLGAKWFDRYSGDLFPSDEVVIDGRKYRPPGYYFRRLQDASPELAEHVSENRRKAVQEALGETSVLTSSCLDPHSDSSWKRLKVRERCASATEASKERDALV